METQMHSKWKPNELKMETQVQNGNPKFQNGIGIRPNISTKIRDVGFIPEYSEFDLEEDLKWMYLVEGVGLAFSLAQIVICNSCLFASIFVVSARSKVSQNKYDLISGFHISEK